MLPEIPGVTSGELQKFKISSLDNKDDRSSVKATFTAMFNPNTYGREVKVITNPQKKPGGESDLRVFNGLGPQSYNFEFLIDGTRASSPTLPGGAGLAIPGAEKIFEPIKVKKQVDEFMKVCYEIDGQKHRSNYLLLSWGHLNDVCLLEKADIKFTLFQPDGEPLRARINAVFHKITPETFKLRSADLTHARDVSEGDNLPLMSSNIYEDPKYYIQLAKANKLKNFRRLGTGKSLNFPPLRNVSE